MEIKSFNLIDEKWIPAEGQKHVSIKEAFSNNSITQIGGTALEKLSVFKLLLAIAQAAFTPETDEEWLNYSNEKMSTCVLDYLNKWHDCFDIFSPEKPFLQFPILKKLGIKKKPYSTIQNFVSSGNTTVLTQSEMEHPVTSPQIALLLIQQMNFAFGGKQTDNSAVLSIGYQGKKSSSAIGAGLGYCGFLHSYYLGKNLIDSIRLNLLTKKNVDSLNVFESGIGIAPWEKMPEGEDDTIAREYKGSLLGRLVGLGRFCLLEHDGLYLTEGIVYSNYKDGVCDPAITIDNSVKDRKTIWADPEKLAWRNLTSLFSFIFLNSPGPRCNQLYLALPRVLNYQASLGIWNCGLKVKNAGAGEFKVSGKCDAVDNTVLIESAEVITNAWYDCYSKEMADLLKLANNLKDCVKKYFEAQSCTSDKTDKAVFTFWNKCNRYAQELINGCTSKDKVIELRKTYAQIAKNCYDENCHAISANQIKIWATNRIKTHTYEQYGEQK